jgi:Bacterial dnaA protein helix-turn-helix
MYAATPQPLIERRRATWCPGALPSQPGLSLPDYSDFEPQLEPDLAAEHRVLRTKIEEAIAMGFDLEPELLSFPSRGRADVALARQVSMYIAHVSLSFSLTHVGRMFDRDRTTVAHACEVVEQQRDDEEFDLAITRLEHVVRITFGVPGRLNGVTTPLPSSYSSRQRIGVA